MANIEKRTTKDGQTTCRVKVRFKGYPTQSKRWVNASACIASVARQRVTQPAFNKTPLHPIINRYNHQPCYACYEAMWD